MKKNKAVIILNHGSRNRLAQRDFLDFVERVKKKKPDLRIEQASMELSSPDIPRIVNKLYDEGTRFITVIPFFLFRGVHIVKDIPEMIKVERAKYADLDIVMGRVLLPDERLEQIVIERIKEIFDEQEIYAA